MDTLPYASPVFYEERARHSTLAAQSQAVERAISTMNSHLHEALTLEDLAAEAYLSPSHFKHVFGRLIGVPPGEFLSALRFQMARRLLLTTSLSVTDICFEVGYTSTGSFTSRFTHLVGLSPRLLRQRAHTFEPPLAHSDEFYQTASSAFPLKNALRGRITIPASFQGTIYIGLFTSSIPQGKPVRCAKLHTSGSYVLYGVPDGFYYLRAAAFPLATDLHSALLPGEKQWLGYNLSPLLIKRGQVIGDPNLVLHPPRLTDPPLVMGLPLL